jgi:hypothetical protein
MRPRDANRADMHDPREFMLTVPALAANLCNNKQISRTAKDIAQSARPDIPVIHIPVIGWVRRHGRSGAK